MADRARHVPVTEAAERKHDLLDRTWDFFASVRVATVLLFLLALASIAGTLIPQEGTYNSWLPPLEFYSQTFGPLTGPLLMRLGLTHAYSSWWFLALLGAVGCSLLVCSLQRFVPLYRVIHRPPVAPLAGFLHHLPVRLTAEKSAPEPLTALRESLRRLGYRVTVQGDRLLAEKGRWQRWGPYVLHTGLLLLLIGGAARAVPGWYSEQTLWVGDGEIVRVPGADWYLKSEKFTAEFYDDGRAKYYATEAVVIDGGQEVLRHTIKMNEPLQYRGLAFYQSSYTTSLGSTDLVLQTQDAAGTLTDAGRFTVDLQQPAPEYMVGGTRLTLVDYFPDFAFDEDGKPMSRSADANNPALRFAIAGYDKPLWLFLAYPDMRFDPKAPYQFQVTGLTPRSTTGLRVKRDAGLPVIWAGLLIISLGTALAFYFSHRRIWAMVEGDRVLVAGQAFRDRLAFNREMKRLADSLPGAQIEQLGG